MPARRAFLPDVRGNDQYLRATWHPDTAVVVISHWVGEVCVASTPVAVADLSTLIEVLVSALQDAAARPPAEPATPVSAGPRWTAAILPGLRRRFQPKLAQVISLHRPPASPEPAAEHE
ncbi:MAG: hypothetical protein M3083_12385 [Actinomycetota bacterium]|nr:hypothetical protein [Actinomycetota bacterium]